MKKEDWIRKLTSRKFWAAIAGFVTGLLIYFGQSEQTAAQVTALIMSGASVIAYILGEGLIDAAGAKTEADTVVYQLQPADEPETHPPEAE